MRDQLDQRVHDCYWGQGLNCARTVLLALAEEFDFMIDRQLYNAACGMHGAGGFGAQCGAVEGALIFLGAYLGSKNWPEDEISNACYGFAERFTEQFGSLRCSKLRPGGFTEQDDPHLCDRYVAGAIRAALEQLQKTLVEPGGHKGEQPSGF